MLTAVFYGIRAAVPALLERGGGSIIDTASVEGSFGANPSRRLRSPAARCAVRSAGLHLTGFPKPAAK